MTFLNQRFSEVRIFSGNIYYVGGEVSVASQRTYIKKHTPK